jgi:hypothetical protein
MNSSLTSRSLLLSCAAGLLAGAAFAADEAQPTWHAQDARVHSVVVRGGEDTAPSAGRSIMVKTRKIDGQAATTELILVGEGGANEVFQVPELAVGESRTFTTESGKTIDVKRMDRGYSLAIDGKTIVLPGEDVLMGGPGDAGSGRREVRVMRVEHSGEGGGEEEIILGDAAHAVFIEGPGHGLANVDFDPLESLKGLEPDVREKVLAALHEILSSPKFLTVEVTDDTDEPGTVRREVIVRKVAPGAPAAK